MKQVIRFAIAEDHQMVRRGVIDIILSFGGYSMDIEAGDGKELYDRLLALSRLPDIVIMDISMPVWNGYETLDAIRKKWPALKVLVLSMHSHELAIIQMIRGGASGYLLKNSPPAELKKALETILEHGIYFSDVASNNIYHRLQHSYNMPFLNQKEIQVLKLCHTDLTYKEIGDKMGISKLSVEGYRNTLFDKLGVKSRSGLIVCAIQMGLVLVE